MNYEPTAKSLLQELGGEQNVVSVTHCMTRLRFVLKDEAHVDDKKVKAISGVVGVMRKGGQYQVIIGNEVAKCYKEVTKLGNFGDGGGAPAKKGGSPVSAVLDAISGSMSPVIPAIIGAGMVQVLNIILGYFLPTDSQTLQLLSVMGNTAFYFLPVLVAYSAGKKFGANPVLVTAVVAILLHPNFIALTGAEGGIRFLGLPVTSFDYSSSLIPAILTAYAMSWIERGVEKITPAFTKNFLKPMLIILISCPVAFVILGPLGLIIGGFLSNILVAIQSHVSILAYIIMAAAMPFIVMTGMHWAFIPVVFGALPPAGTEESLMLPAMLISNVGIAGCCLAIWLKSKNSNTKQLGFSSGISALFAGVTEPGLYGVVMPLKKPLIALIASNAITGLIAGFLHVAATSFASPSLLALPIFVNAERPSNFIMACACAAISIVLAFALTWILGFEDPSGTKEEETPKTAEKPAGPQAIGAPVAGKTIPLSQVDDDTFASGVLGLGVAIIPSTGKVYAPFDGTVENVAESLHALGLRSDGGVELLVHVGLETVTLNGRHFTLRAKEGQRFRKGDLLLEFDLEAIKAAGFDTVTPVIVTNVDEMGRISAQEGLTVQVGDTVIQTA